MSFSLEHISLANLFQGGNNYIVFSIMGMLIVFVGLTFISIYITLLPKILNLAKHRKAGITQVAGPRKSSSAESTETRDTELLLAIAVALHLDQDNGSGSERITWKRHEEKESAWLTAGRVGSLSLRSQHVNRRS